MYSRSGRGRLGYWPVIRYALPMPGNSARPSSCMSNSPSR